MQFAKIYDILNKSQPMPGLRSGMAICGFDWVDLLHVSDRYPDSGTRVVSPKKMLLKKLAFAQNF